MLWTVLPGQFQLQYSLGTPCHLLFPLSPPFSHSVCGLTCFSPPFGDLDRHTAPLVIPGPTQRASNMHGFRQEVVRHSVTSVWRPYFQSVPSNFLSMRRRAAQVLCYSRPCSRVSQSSWTGSAAFLPSEWEKNRTPVRVPQRTTSCLCCLRSKYVAAATLLPGPHPPLHLLCVVGTVRLFPALIMPGIFSWVDFPVNRTPSHVTFCRVFPHSYHT